MFLLLTGTFLALSVFGGTQGTVPVSYLGCYREFTYHPLFNRVYFNYRNGINLRRRPNWSFMIQVCAREAVKRKYSYFAIKRYGQCTWGRRGLSITRGWNCRNRCHYGVGRLWYAAVYRVQGSSVCQEGRKSFDKCGQRCDCIRGRLVNCVRIRKEFTSLSLRERRRYIQTILKASTDPTFKNDYDRLINDHRILFTSGIHERIHFLPWHRYFILLYENLLRRVDCRVTVPYWDWSRVSGDPFRTNPTDLWHSGNAGFGGNGVAPNGCVQTGPFRESIWSLPPPPAGAPTEPGPRCLRRRFNGNPPDLVAVNRVLQINLVNFTDFELLLRINLHDVVHCLIGGTMCFNDSASAPEFFLHHGFIDKIWDDWQKRSDAHLNVFFPNINEVMPGTQVFPREVVDLSSQPGGVRAEYQQPKSPVRPSSGQGHNQQRRRFSSLNAKVIRVFHIKSTEVSKAMEMAKMLQP